MDMAEQASPGHPSAPHDEDGSLSDHSDSWEVISRGARGSPAHPSSPRRAATPSEGRLSCDAFSYTLHADDMHSDADTHRTDDVMRRGEIDYPSPAPSTTAPAADVDSAAPTDDEDAGATHLFCPWTKGSGSAPACAAPAARLAAATGALFSTLADRLRWLAARVRSYVASHQPAAQRLAGLVVSGARELARSIRVAAGPGVQALAVPLSGAGVAAVDIAGAVGQAARRALTRARKGAATARLSDIDWVRLGLILGCAGLLGGVMRANAANARLAARLAQREGELAELVARIVALQRSITSQRVPIIRHTAGAAAAAAGGGACPGYGWASVVQAI